MADRSKTPWFSVWRDEHADAFIAAKVASAEGRAEFDRIFRELPAKATYRDFLKAIEASPVLARLRARLSGGES